MPTRPINGTIDLSTSSSSFIINCASFLGYSFDLNLNSSTANGTINIYCQNTNPYTDTYIRPPKLSYSVVLGKYQGAQTSQTVDSAFLTAAAYCVIIWTGNAGTGTLDIVGTQEVFF